MAVTPQGRGQEQRSEMSIHHRLSHQFYLVPTVDCRKPFRARTKGRVSQCSQKCLTKTTLPNQLQGAKRTSQKCHHVHAPASFIWSRHDHAAMPRGKRSKGRITISLQKCHVEDTLPNQLQGVMQQTQQCQLKTAPTEFGPIDQRRNARMLSPNNQRPQSRRSNATPQSPRN